MQETADGSDIASLQDKNLHKTRMITLDYGDPDFRDADINRFEAHKSAPESKYSVSQLSVSKAGDFCIK